MKHIKITRTTVLPDRMRLARYARAPEIGPRALFFSGGTALREVCGALVRHTHNSIHIVTPFDSGGSSAKLRESFRMIAVGDVRNRLMALADRSFTGNPEIFALFAYRFPREASQAELKEALAEMIRGKGRLMSSVPDPMRKIIRSHLDCFLEKMPEEFDLRGASIGNLILAGGYFKYNCRLDPVMYLFSKLAEVRGVVRPVCNRSLHLVAELEDGRVLVGQHLLTGKEAAPISSPVKRVWLADDPATPVEREVEARSKVKALIRQADVIVYPVGSFYSSLIANLLVRGIGESVAETECPKVYTPNTYSDPEQLGLTLSRQVEVLLHYLRAGTDTPASKLLNFVMVDTHRASYAGGKGELKKIEKLGVGVIDIHLASAASDHGKTTVDPDLYVENILSLA